MSLFLLVGSVGIVGMDDLFSSVDLVICLVQCIFFRQVVLVWELRSWLRNDTLCHVLSACLLFTFRHGNRMWVRLWLLSLVSLRTRIVSAEMLGVVFEGLGVLWKRPRGTLGASWAILEASWESC